MRRELLQTSGLYDKEEWYKRGEREGESDDNDNEKISDQPDDDTGNVRNGGILRDVKIGNGDGEASKAFWALG